MDMKKRVLILLIILMRTAIAETSQQQNNRESSAANDTAQELYARRVEQIRESLHDVKGYGDDFI